MTDDSPKLTLEQSAALLRIIFPQYPVLLPCKAVPPKETWASLKAVPQGQCSSKSRL
jgi:hypothetical protein